MAPAPQRCMYVPAQVMGLTRSTVAAGCGEEGAPWLTNKGFAVRDVRTLVVAVVEGSLFARRE